MECFKGGGVRREVKERARASSDNKKKIGSMDMENLAPSNKAPVGGKKAKTIEQTYTKKSQLEHILLRPDTYGEGFPCSPSWLGHTLAYSHHITFSSHSPISLPHPHRYPPLIIQSAPWTARRSRCGCMTARASRS